MIEAAAIITSTRFLTPLINDLYSGAKKFGARGFAKWEGKTFARKLAGRMTVIEEVRTLWKPDGPVSIAEFYHPPRVNIDGKSKLATRLSDLGTGNIILEGIVGQGKSIYLRSLAIAEYKNNDAQRLPLFIELRTLTTKHSLAQAIIRQFDAFDLAYDEVTHDYLFSSGKCCLLLDGFDELDEALTKETLEHLAWLRTKYNELQIIITSRPGHEIQKVPYFRVIQIAPLTAGEHAAFLHKLGVDSGKSQLIRAAIRESPSKISSLITTPLMLTLVVMVYEADAQIPDSIPEFFDSLFQVVFSKHDHLKAGFNRKHHCGLSERKLLELFEAFCFMTTQLGYGRTLSDEQFVEAFDLAIEYTDNCTCDVEKFRLDITKVACLMLQEGLNTYTFLHKSIVEYYAAAHVKHSIEENAVIFYNEVAKDSRIWGETLLFLRSIDSYRFQKYYVGTVINAAKGFLEQCRSAPDSKLADEIEKTYTSNALYYKPNEDNSKYIQTATRHAAIFERIVGNFPSLVIDAMKRMAPDELTTAEFKATFGPIDISDEDDIFGDLVSLKRLVIEYGAKEIRLAIEIFSTRIANAEEAANAIISSQQKKKLIFSGKATKN